MKEIKTNDRKRKMRSVGKEGNKKGDIKNREKNRKRK
jgi:hypothetical protein